VIAYQGESLGHFFGTISRADQLSHKAIAEHLGVRVAWVQAGKSHHGGAIQPLPTHCLIKVIEVDPKQLALMLVIACT